MRSLRCVTAFFLLQLAFAGIAYAVNQAPVATITAPASGSQYNAPASITLSATASDPDGSVAKVEFFNGATLIPGATVTTAPYTFTWANVAAGTYSVTAKATDNLGKAASSAAIQVKVITPTTVITSPANGAVVGKTAVVTGTYTGTDATVVIVTAGAGHSSVASSGAQSFSANVELARGANTIEVQVARSDGTFEIVDRSVTAVDPPVVVMTAPTSTAPYTAPAQIPLAADAASAQGTIAQVEFFDNSTSLGIVAAAPYTKTVTLDPANHSVFARATDSFGFTADSRPLPIVVQSQPPVVSLTSPSAGTTFCGSTGIVLTADAHDPDGSITNVAYYDNGNFLMTAPSPETAPYAVTWTNPATGSHTLTARATDNSGLTVESSPGVTITVSSSANPTITMSSPSGNTSLRAPANVSFAATATAASGSISKVEFLLNNVVYGPVMTAPYTFTATGIAVGSYVAKARATDSNNCVATSTTANVTVAANALPTVNITSPASGAAFNAPGTVAITASASDSDGTIAKVEFFADSVLVGTAATSPYSYSWANPPLGSHTLTAKATDNDGGATVSAPVSITVNGIVTAITAPANGANYTAPATFDINTTASTSSGNITSVEFLDGSTVIYTNNIPTGFSSVTVTYTASGTAAGTHVYTTRAHDDGGRVGSSNPVTVTIATAPTPPQVTLGAPTNGAFYVAPANIRLSAQVTQGSGAVQKVDFFSGTTLIGTSTQTPYDFVWNGVSAGSYNVSARVTDVLGAAGSSQVNPITVGSLGLSIDSPASGSSLTGDSVLVSGTIVAPANSGVTVNGAIALIDANNHFYVNVPLVSGGNSIAATITTQSGGAASQTITVSSDGSVAPVRMSVDQLWGLSTLNATASATNAKAVDVTISVNGTTVGTLPAGQTASFPLSFGAPGTYPITMTATDGQNGVITNSFVVVVADDSQMEQMFQSIWGGMTDALISGDKATALSFFNAGARAKYGPVFDVLMPSMGQIVSSFSALGRSDISTNIGEYVVTRTYNGAAHLYFIYFLLDPDGVWRLDSM